MGTIDTAITILLLAGAAAGVVGFIVLYRRTRQQAQSGAETRPLEQEEAQQEIEKEPRREERESQKLKPEWKPKEEEQPGAEEEAQPKEGEEHPQAKQENKGVAPGKRGGRPRGSLSERGEQIAQENQHRRQKPEVVCWKRERRWILAVEVPDDLLTNPNLSVRQNALPLTQDESREACWHLNQACGKVEVCWIEDDSSRETRIELGEENCLLFKLSGQNQNQGRRVNLPSSGSYLAIVPDTWDRDDALSGPPPVAPEPVSLAGYQAHFFIVEKDGSQKIAFRAGEDVPVEIKSKAPRLGLVGVRLNDASEDMGPLFGAGPPKIRALDDRVWKDIGAIVVGEEGGGKGRWRLEFSVDPDEIEQAMPCEVTTRKGGWYFLRFYDTGGDLVESLDFRFLSALKEIRILQSSAFPPGGGHKPVRVELLHEPICVVQQADDIAPSIQIEHEDNKTTLTIPPDPAYDRTCWRVGPQGGPVVEIAVLVERLWWAVEQEDNEPSEWGDKPLTLLPEDFAATSKKALWLRLPKRRWVNRVLAGFEQQEARPYAVRVGERAIAIPLRDFGDSPEVEVRTEEHPFKVWIKLQDVPVQEAIVGILQASQPPIEDKGHWSGFGRKKTAVAKAILQRGSGAITVDNYPLDDYFKNAPPKAKRFLQRLLELEQVRVALLEMEASLTVTGSSPGSARQAKAAAHALARALASYDTRLKVLLKQSGFGGVRVRKVPIVLRKE
jgi:small subunit ribosomal protein S9